ncbi:ABC transporter ATP-binding protein [Aurantiacibacter poecillastricola]|uniref:ABC transporter ATP-binding protein n=1 Tax=Aurantiacibacter poecillastricola TaxID=3064385 RepID=UPI00273F75D1|nr:ABC transporter ATP-binding protein [Aurantiacibacter sp. 219JJ12-13]MDP5261651.1 ABC transporter ATP-binding protein [Aurantiacibacter sp. 219JJ12-13]
MLAAANLAITGRLEHVSAALEPGTITAICGPNGAGKSTLLSALAGLLAPDSGEVLLDGEPLDVTPPRQRAQALGYLPQSAEIAWDVSVASIAALGRLPHRDRGKFAIAKALAATDMADFAARPASTLSGGEKARALLARVLAGEPRWILADEPLAALDLAHQLNLLAVLRREAEAGTGVVIVVHDLALAMNHADRVVVLDEGKVAAEGTPAEALSPEIIASVWGVEARWLGEPGARALVTRM